MTENMASRCYNGYMELEYPLCSSLYVFDELKILTILALHIFNSLLSNFFWNESFLVYQYELDMSADL
jgi:hypothetical protein